MKNIFLIPTDKPCKLSINCQTGLLQLGLNNRMFHDDINIHITSNEEIRVGDWYYLPRTNDVYKCNEDPTELNLERTFGVSKIILTIDQDLIKDGVQEIPDEFLEWFIKNPSCEYVDLIGLRKEKGYEFLGYEIIIPTEESYELESKQETLEEVAEKIADNFEEPNFKAGVIYGVIEGAKYQQGKMYSEEDMIKVIKSLFEKKGKTPGQVIDIKSFNKK